MSKLIFLPPLDYPAMVFLVYSGNSRIKRYLATCLCIVPHPYAKVEIVLDRINGGKLRITVHLAQPHQVPASDHLDHRSLGKQSARSQRRKPEPLFPT